MPKLCGLQQQPQPNKKTAVSFGGTAVFLFSTGYRIFGYSPTDIDRKTEISGKREVNRPPACHFL